MNMTLHRLHLTESQRWYPVCLQIAPMTDNRDRVANGPVEFKQQMFKDFVLLLIMGML